MGASFLTLAVVAFAFFTDSFLYGLIIPLTPHLPAHIVDEWMLGMMYAGYSIGVVIATLFFGIMTDRLGYRRPMVWGAWIQLAAILILPLARNFPEMLLGRTLHGAAAAVVWTSGLALIAELYPQSRARMIGVVMMTGTFGLVSGPVLGGFLFDQFNYKVPFIFIGALTALDGLFRWGLIPKITAKPSKQLELGTLVRDPSILTAGAITALGAWCWCILEALLPNHLWQTQGASPSAVGTVFTVGALIYGLICPGAGMVSDRFGTWRTIVGGLLMMTVTLPLVSYSRSLMGAAIALCIVNTAYAFLMNPAMSELGEAIDRIGSRAYGTVYIVYNIAYSIGMAGSGFLSGFLASTLSLKSTLLLTSLVSFFCFIVAMPLRHKGRFGQAT